MRRLATGPKSPGRGVCVCGGGASCPTSPGQVTSSARSHKQLLPGPRRSPREAAERGLSSQATALNTKVRRRHHGKSSSRAGGRRPRCRAARSVAAVPPALPAPALSLRGAHSQPAAHGFKPWLGEESGSCFL